MLYRVDVVVVSSFSKSMAAYNINLKRAKVHSFIKLHVLRSTNLVNVAFSLILLRYQIHSLSSHSPISFPSPPFYITCSFSLQYSHLFSKTSSCFLPYYSLITHLNTSRAHSFEFVECIVCTPLCAYAKIFLLDELYAILF